MISRTTLGAAALLLGSMPAYAQHTCGRDIEPPFNASVTLPNGQVANHLVNALWWFPNDESECTAMLERTNDVYYFGYNDGGNWPTYQEVHGAESWSDGTQTWKAFYIYGGDNLTPNSTYSVSIICPPNLHE